MGAPPRSRGAAEARARHSAIARSIQLPMQHYLHTEAFGGIALVAAALVGLVWANSPWASSYDALWHTPVTISVASWTFAHDLRHLVNDGLMAIFFFVVGLEIKREVLRGSLADPKQAALPVAAAIGGMVVPAAVYALIAGQGPGAAGWGIPMATDIAFAVAVLSLTGVRHELKVLLLALAIVDDIGAILVVAIFYATGISWTALGVAAACVVAVLAMQRAGVHTIGFYVPVALLLWVAVLESGVHATMAGVVLGALTPARAVISRRTFGELIERMGGRLSESDAPGEEERELLTGEVEELVRQSESPLERTERLFHPWSAGVVLPLFALANSGIPLSAEAIGEAVRSTVAMGVFVGLVVGKPLGVLALAWLAVRSGLAALPEGLRWRELAMVGVVAGIGFTVSIFITDLAFSDQALATAAKTAVLAASAVAALLGVISGSTIYHPQPSVPR